MFLRGSIIIFGFNWGEVVWDSRYDSQAKSARFEHEKVGLGLGRVVLKVCRLGNATGSRDGA